MKFRTGFVSNSSTSSFLLMTSVETFESVLEGLDEDARAVAEVAMWKEDVFGIPRMVFAYISTDTVGLEDFIEVDGVENIHKAWGTFLKAIRATGDYYIDTEDA